MGASATQLLNKKLKEEKVEKGKEINIESGIAQLIQKEAGKFQYAFRDFYVVAFLKSKGARIIKVIDTGSKPDRRGLKEKTFILETDYEVDSLLKDFVNRQATVIALNFVDDIKHMKKIIHGDSL